MTKKQFNVDLTKPMEEQELVGHNRWHPDIPSVFAVDPGESFRLECIEWTDGQIGNNDDPSDVRDVSLERVHVLSGPVHVNGAEPGDLLIVDILDVGPLTNWGHNGVFDETNGGSFLVDEFPDAQKSIWDFNGIFATSRHIPGVEFAGIMHPGILGVAPSQEMLDEWNKREKELVDQNPDRVPPLANLPTKKKAVVGHLEGEDFERVASEGARTVPPRENGGNCDIKNLSAGSRTYFPVYVDGAKLSTGDLHFSQGDGEITFCGGIEMSGYVELRVDVIKDGARKYNIERNPLYQPGPVDPNYQDLMIFQGISVDHTTGEQKYLDANLAFKNACLNAIDYMKTLGYTGEQAYMLLSAAPVESTLASVVDIPNSVCTIGIPKEIFNPGVLKDIK